MYLRRLHVRNLKRLRDFKLDFTDANGKPQMWTVLIGENGTAKTTLLQAIALAAAGKWQVNTLAVPVMKHLCDRRSDNPMMVQAWFEFTELSKLDHAVHPHRPPKWKPEFLGSEVTLKPGSTLRAQASYVRRIGDLPKEPDVDPLDAAREADEHLWFVAGYGVARGLPRDVTYTPPLDRPSIERLAPLFDSQAVLTSTSFANHFLKKDLQEGRPRGTTSRTYSSMLNAAIRRGGPALFPDIVKMELRGQGGAKSSADLIESDRFHQRMGEGEPQKMAGEALSHGYQSTFAWIADLIGHVLLESKNKLDTTDMEGLILLDEIDLYLHPTWQATFITALRRVFPKMQFVATTHSPVVLAELAPHEVVRLIVDPKSGDVTRGSWDPRTGELVPVTNGVGVQPDPRPMTGSELYRTWFGLDRLTPNPHGDQLREYLAIGADPLRSAEDEARLKKLESRLKAAGIEYFRQPVTREHEH
jgi:AAA domain, putative AbiEii toxin, Type IV TA system/AAA ATPase domain